MGRMGVGAMGACTSSDHYLNRRLGVSYSSQIHIIGMLSSRE